MSKLNRYLFVKKIYKDYVVFIKSNNYLITYDRDLKIVLMMGFNNFFKANINHIILAGLELKRFKYDNNNYFYYFKVTLLIDIIKKFKKY